VDGEVGAVTRGLVGHAAPSEGWWLDGGEAGLVVGVGELPAGDVGVGVDVAGVGAARGWVVVRAEQPATTTAAANKTVAMMRTGRMATSPQIEHDPVGQGFSVGRAGHAAATVKRHGKRETASTRSRSSIETSTLPVQVRQCGASQEGTKPG